MDPKIVLFSHFFVKNCSSLIGCGRFFRNKIVDAAAQWSRNRTLEQNFAPKDQNFLFIPIFIQKKFHRISLFWSKQFEFSVKVEKFSSRNYSKFENFQIKYV